MRVTLGDGSGKVGGGIVLGLSYNLKSLPPCSLICIIYVDYVDKSDRVGSL